VRLAKGVEQDPVVATHSSRTHAVPKEGLVERVRDICANGSDPPGFFLHAGAIDSTDPGQELPACFMPWVVWSTSVSWRST